MELNARSLIYKLQKTELIWRYGANLSPTINYQIGSKYHLSLVEKSLIGRLNSDGIAFTSVKQLFGDEADFLMLDSAVEQLLEFRKEEIGKLKSKADLNNVGSKTFNLEALGSELTFDPASIFAQFALKRSLLNIADAYFGMCAKLRYYNVWKTFASTGNARESQLWHFDREDNYILKVFLLLDDVDEGSGPFFYAPGTHKKGKYRTIRPQHFIEGGVKRTTDEQMQAVFPEDKWITGIGKKGSIILADTRGYHKGGEARTKDRLMYTCMYTSPASQSKNLIKIAENFDRSSLDDRELRALGVK